MKKSLLFILASFGVIACNSYGVVERPQDNNIEVNLTINAGFDNTKTFIEYSDGSYTPFWQKNNAIHLIGSNNMGNRKEYKNTLDDGEMAQFVSDSPLSFSEAGQYTIYAYYPSSMYKTRSGSKYSFELKADQILTSLSSFDPSFDLLLAKPETISIESGKYSTALDMRFRRVFGVVKVILKDESNGLLSGKNVKKVTITSNESTLTGVIKIDLETGKTDSWTTSVKTVSGTYGGSDFSVNGTNAAYLIVNPTELKAGSDLTVDVVVDDESYSISKTVTLPSDIIFKEGAVTPLTVRLTTDNISISGAPSIGELSIEDVPAEGITNGTATLVYYNAEDWTPGIVSFDGCVSAASVSGTTLTYSVSENQSFEKSTGTIIVKISKEGQTDITRIINVTQLAAIQTDLIPISTTTSWATTFAAQPQNSEISQNNTEPTLIDNMSFITNGNAIKFGSSNSRRHCQLAGTGSPGEKCCLQFKVNGNGTIRIEVAAGGDNSDRYIGVAVNSEEVFSVAVPKKAEIVTINKEVTATAGNLINIYSKKSGLNIYDIIWTPAN